MRCMRHSKSKNKNSRSKKTFIHRHEENFKAKEEDIRKRDLEIQIHLINFCQYLQENDSKRKKAEERFKQDLEVYNKK